MNLPERPITLLIAALGGEGGGVMADWLMEAATRSGFPAQATSIPGVAQRTGATTYYLEIYPAQREALGGREPVLSLTPSPGNVDVMVASELIEAGRAMLNGYVSPERTTLIASTHRIYATVEKMQMADGRFESGRVLEAARELARRAVLFDMRKLAQESGTPLAVHIGSFTLSGLQGGRPDQSTVSFMANAGASKAGAHTIPVVAELVFSGVLAKRLHPNLRLLLEGGYNSSSISRVNPEGPAYSFSHVAVSLEVPLRLGKKEP